MKKLVNLVLGLIEIVVYNDLYDYKSYADVDYVVDFIIKFVDLMEGE